MNEIKNQKGFGGIGVGTGGISILAIFVVLCLTTLATLSIVSARADYVLTNKTAQATAQYYVADSEAEEKLATVTQVLINADWQKDVTALGCEVINEEGKLYVSFLTPISDTKQLFSKIEIAVSGGVPTGEFRKAAWEVTVKDTYDNKKGIVVLT